ncbi:hypothetical protein PHMEG_00018923 [Phytophthora megakarya]|uniref:Uncharacterized protein n=1 Tax=Phytophthora megakarya TaxID=4795 RepID=A0A225VSK9_9STRA|nr:hypothetical protein PHMEG_00018923 [Phytophthora megakarya]
MTQTPEKTLEVETTAQASTPSGTSLGGRVRKTTQMFTFSQATSDEPEEFAPPVGKGVKVREMEFVRSNVEALGKKELDMIKQLYSTMFGRRFQQKNVRGGCIAKEKELTLVVQMKLIKEHILDFSGIIEQDEKSREQLVAKMGKWKLVFVHEVMDLLAVDRSKKSFDEDGKPHNKEALLDRLIDWLYNPQVTKIGEKKAAIAAKKEKQKANKRAKKAKDAKKSEAKPAKKKRKTAKKTAVADEEEEEEDREATESEGEEESDFEEAKKPSKKRKVTRRPKKAVVESDDDEEEEAEAEKTKEDKKDEEKPSKTDEPAEKDESKPETETLDADVCSKVRDIIAKGDAEELTVKKVIIAGISTSANAKN